MLSCKHSCPPYPCSSIGFDINNVGLICVEIIYYITLHDLQQNPHLIRALCAVGMSCRIESACFCDGRLHRRCEHVLINQITLQWSLHVTFRLSGCLTIQYGSV